MDILLLMGINLIGSSDVAQLNNKLHKIDSLTYTDDVHLLISFCLRIKV